MIVETFGERGYERDLLRLAERQIAIFDHRRVLVSLATHLECENLRRLEDLRMREEIVRYRERRGRSFDRILHRARQRLSECHGNLETIFERVRREWILEHRGSDIESADEAEDFFRRVSVKIRRVLSVRTEDVG